MQNGRVLTTRIQGCIVNGAARGDLSSETVYVKLARMTCDQPGGRVAVSEVKGFISFAGKSGVRGRVVSREGSLISQALIAGIVGGFGRGFSANANSIFSGVGAGANGARAKLSGNDILGGGLGQGAADAADTVSKYLIERAEQYQPVVEMPTGIEVEIVFLDGAFVRTP
jgi:conjugal transfer pilus assembly protein TraB